MEMHEKQIQSIVKSLKTESWIWFATLAILAVMSVYFAPIMKKLEPGLTITLQSILLLLMLLGLPATFMWFRNKMAELSKEMDIPRRLNRYETYSRIRQAVFFIFGLLVLFMHVFTYMKGAPMLFMVVILLSMFILPSRGRLVMEASLAKPEEEEPKNEEDLGSE
jgi:signal transduction histidine kinase